MITRYISVFTGSPDSVEAYLYDHSKIISKDGRKLIIETTAATVEDAEFLAHYQAARLQSGLHGALYQATEQAAQDHLAEFGA